MSRDPLRYFRVEARELLDKMSSGVLEIERGGGAPDAVAQMLRHAHTLKGAARVVQQRELSDLAHGFEDLLAPHRQGTALDGEVIERLLTMLDVMNARLTALPAPSAAPLPPTAATVASPTPLSPPAGMPAPGVLDAPSTVAAAGSITAPNAAPNAAPITVPVPSAEPVARSLRTELAEIDAVLDDLHSVHEELNAIRHAARAVQPLRAQVQRLAGELAALRSTDAVPAQAAASGRLRERVDAWSKELGRIEIELGAGAERAARELRQAHEATERLRLVPAHTVFHALERTLRDVARGAGRQAEFSASGGDVRMDGDVLDRVLPALVQLVRNAIAHGIEGTAERLAAGKPAAGRVTLQVARQGQNVLFRCLDDGRGVDLQALRRAAGGSAARSDEDLIALLLRGGYSSARAVDAFAGRGVGLDIVRETAQRLGGVASLHTEPGRGCRFELCVPVSLVTVEALVVHFGAHRAGIALGEVRGALRVAPADLRRGADGVAVLRDGALVPLVWLDALLGMAPARRQPRTVPAFLVDAVGIGGPGAARGLVAVAVDHVAGVQTLLLRPPPELAPVDPTVAGIYMDADGSARMVLDAAELARRAGQGTEHEAAAEARAPARVLVVDDSLTTRMLERSILESAGYSVQLASSAEEGLEIAHGQDFALVLVDVEMPGMDGFSFIEAARRHPTLRDVPCVLVTSRDTPADRLRAEAVGARAHIVKGEFDQGNFLTQVAKLVGRDETQDHSQDHARTLAQVEFS